MPKRLVVAMLLKKVDKFLDNYMITKAVTSQKLLIKKPNKEYIEFQ